MRKAIDISMKIKVFQNARSDFLQLPRRLPMLKFHPIPIRADEEPGGDFIRGLSQKEEGKAPHPASESKQQEEQLQIQTVIC